jgi:hypothetical protein
MRNRRIVLAAGGALLGLGWCHANLGYSQLTNVSASGSGSASASGYYLPTNYSMPLSTGSFTGVNMSTSAGNLSQVWADASNSFSSSANLVSAQVNSDASWVDQNDPSDTFWNPNGTGEAFETLIFQVAVSGTYMLDPTGGGPFGTSEEANQLFDHVTVTGGSVDLIFTNGVGHNLTDSQPWANDAPYDLIPLTAGQVYTANLTCSAECTDFSGQLPEESAEMAGLDVAVVPEPVVGLPIMLGLGIAALRRRVGRGAG